MMREVKMLSCQMSCWNCFYGCQQDNETLRGVLSDDAIEKGESFYIICIFSPISYIIGEYIYLDDKPDVVCHPYNHYCGQGKWRDESGRWITRLEASDAAEIYEEHHCIGELP
jgi:hypothetical protein